MVTLAELLEVARKYHNYVLCNNDDEQELGRYNSREDIPKEYTDCLVMEQSTHYNDLWINIQL